MITLGDLSVANGAKQHLGESTPLSLDGQPQSAVSLLTMTLTSVLDLVTAAKGAPPDRVVLTHPAVWGQYRREQFHEVRRQTGLDAVNILTEPAAAATHYANRRRLPIGSTIAVYDLGGGTFDATVVRLTDAGTEIVGIPQGLEWIGGNAFDDAILNHVDQSVGGVISGLDPVDPNTATTRHQLRLACRKAKERLSQEELAAISFSIPGRRLAGRRADVRLSRDEFESMIQPSVRDTVAALQRALDSAEQTVGDLAGVLVIGGSAQIPLVTRMLSEALGRPVTVDPEAQQCVALGAAGLSRPQPLSARAMATAVPPTPTPPVGIWPVPNQGARNLAYSPAGTPEAHGSAGAEAITTLLPAMPEAEPPPPEPDPLTDTGELLLARALPAPVDFSDPDSFPDPGSAPKTGRGTDRRRIWMIVAAVSALLLVGAGIIAFTGDDDDPRSNEASGPTWATGAPYPGDADSPNDTSTGGSSSNAKSPTPTPSGSKSPTPTPTSTRPTPTATPTTTRNSGGGGAAPGGETKPTTPVPSATTTAPAAPSGPQSSVRYCNSISGTRMTLSVGGAAQSAGDCGTTDMNSDGTFQIVVTRISDGAVKSSQTFTQSDLSGTARARGSFASPQFAYGFLS